MGYTYQPLKSKVLPTIKQAVDALKKADETDPASRDVRPLMSILTAMAERSPRLRGHILTRQAAVNSYRWKLKPLETADQEKVDRATIRCRKVINQLLEWHIDRHLYGAMAVELTWNPGTPQGTAPSILRRYDPAELEQDGPLKENLRILLTEGDTFTRYDPNTDRPETWLLDVDGSRYRGGLLRTLIFHEILVNENLQEWAAFNRKLKGIIQARFDQWASKEEKEAAAAALKKVAEHNYSATSKAVEFVFNKTADYLGASGFKDFKHELEADRAIVLLGQANTPQLPKGGGSRAALEVQALITADIHFATINSFQRFVNDGLLLHDWRVNAEPNAIEAPYELEIQLAEDNDTEKEARTLGYIKQAGIPIRRDEVYERLQYSEPEDGDDTFEFAATPGVPF